MSASLLLVPDLPDTDPGEPVPDDTENTPAVIAYRLGKIEDQLVALTEATVSPAIYKIHRDADDERMRRIEARQVREEELRGKQDEAKRTMRLAIALAVVSPFLSYVLGAFGPGAGG